MQKNKVNLHRVCVGNVCRAVPHSPNKNVHWGFLMRWRKAWKDEVYYALKEINAEMQKKPHITFELRTTHPQDYDNSIASIKPLLDGMKGVVIKDDSPEHIWTPKVKTVKVNTKEEEGVTIYF